MSSKRCSSCGEIKNKEQDFYPRDLKCKECISRINRLKRFQKRKKLFEYYLSKGCNRCEERDVCTLQAHHLQPEDKYMKVSKMVASGVKWGGAGESGKVS